MKYFHFLLSQKALDLFWESRAATDFNDRIGQNERLAHGSLGKYGGERTLNESGRRLIEFCIENQLLVGNSFYPHKKYTRSHMTERGGSVVTHKTRIREVPSSNPGADQPDWGFFVVFLSHQGKCWFGFSLPRSIWPLFIKFTYHKIKISELNKWTIDNTTIEIHSLLIHTQRS